MSVNFDDRVTGMLVGAAIGDALGAPYEFKAPGTFTVGSEFGRGVFDTAPGAPTDDSTLVRLHAESWVEACNKPNTKDQFRPSFDKFKSIYVDKLIAWKKSGPPDIGGQTSSAISTWQSTGKGPGETAGSGNGALMAVAPIAAVFLDKGLAQKHAADFSSITHCNGESRFACQRVVGTLHDLLHGVPVDPYVSQLPAWVDVSGGHMGFSLAGMDIALCALEEFLGVSKKWWKGKPSIWPALLQVVEIGGDTDTNAAIAGAVLGAAVGITAMTKDPKMKRLVDTVQGLDDWMKLGQDLCLVQTR
jgi:ADP-ribosyl-[dinitrogen reductase] hydrolase